MRRDLSSHAVDERLDRVLRRRIDWLPMDRLVARNGRRHDDVAGLARYHSRQDGAHATEDSVDVERDHAIPFLGVALHGVAGDIASGIGEENVDPPKT